MTAQQLEKHEASRHARTSDEPLRPRRVRSCSDSKPAAVELGVSMSRGVSSRPCRAERQRYERRAHNTRDPLFAVRTCRLTAISPCPSCSEASRACPIWVPRSRLDALPIEGRLRVPVLIRWRRGAARRRRTGALLRRRRFAGSSSNRERARRRGMCAYFSSVPLSGCYFTSGVASAPRQRGRDRREHCRLHGRVRCGKIDARRLVQRSRLPLIADDVAVVDFEPAPRSSSPACPDCVSENTVIEATGRDPSDYPLSVEGDRLTTSATSSFPGASREPTAPPRRGRRAQPNRSADRTAPRCRGGRGDHVPYLSRGFCRTLQTVREHWLICMKLVQAVPVCRACVDFDLERLDHSYEPLLAEVRQLLAGQSVGDD